MLDQPIESGGDSLLGLVVSAVVVDERAPERLALSLGGGDRFIGLVRIASPRQGSACRHDEDRQQSGMCNSGHDSQPSERGNRCNTNHLVHPLQLAAADCLPWRGKLGALINITGGRVTGKAFFHPRGEKAKTTRSEVVETDKRLGLDLWWLRPQSVYTTARLAPQSDECSLFAKIKPEAISLIGAKWVSTCREALCRAG
jgi:hypothetical protein